MGSIRIMPPWLAARFSTATCNTALITAFLLAAPPNAAAQGLKDVFEAAWTRQPMAQAREARRDAFAARRTAAEALLPGPPALSLDHETDRIGRNDGLRKFTGEVALPLWLPGQKERAQAVVGAEREAYDGQLALARLTLAGEVRDAYWLARAALAEERVAQAALDSVAALEADVARRVKAGELARVDGNRALAETQLAKLALAEAQARMLRALAQFRALTGFERVPDESEVPVVSARPDAAAHPDVTAAARTAEAARTRLAQAAGDTRDAPELGLGAAQARTDATRPWEQTVLLRLRIPFGGDNRNRPRIAAASAELAEGRAVQARAAARVEAEMMSAEREREAARNALPLAESRAALARDTQALIARGFTAGEFDLPTRLRAERELKEAESGQVRARIEAGRAESRLKQAYGMTP